MSTLLLVAAASCAVAAALRSTWSPCGLSMLSKITPLAEPTRNYTYRGTVAWFVAVPVLYLLGPKVRRLTGRLVHIPGEIGPPDRRRPLAEERARGSNHIRNSCSR